MKHPKTMMTMMRNMNVKGSGEYKRRTRTRYNSKLLVIGRSTSSMELTPAPVRDRVTCGKRLRLGVTEYRDWQCRYSTFLKGEG